MCTTSGDYVLYNYWNDEVRVVVHVYSLSYMYVIQLIIVELNL